VATYHSTLDSYLKSHWQGFLAAYGALRVFAEEITRRADQVDETRLQKMAEDLAYIFGDDVPMVLAELREFFPSLEHDHLYPDFSDNSDVRESIDVFSDSAFKRRVSRWVVEEPQKSARLLNLFADAMYQPPVSGLYLRQSALVALVSAVEVFVDGLLFGYGWYKDEKYQSISDPAEKETQVRQAYDLRTWKKRLEKLIEIVPSGDWKTWQEEWSEIIARRNALVHVGGRVDAQYLQQASKAYQPENVKEGRVLLVPTTYLHRTVEVALLFTFTLTQSSWRGWQRHRKAADAAVNNLIYETLRQKRYPLVVELAQRAGKFDLHWHKRQYVLVNWTIALRKQGKTEEMRSVLTHLESRQKRLWQIEIALNILQGNYDKARRRMEQANRAGKLRKHVSPHWPLFDPLRGEAWFENLFAARHGELPSQKKRR
jgi:hypothetical protein